MTKQTIDTSIKAALINEGVTEIAFTNSGTTYPVNVEDLPEATLLRIFDYGKRIFNDAVNGAKHQGKDPEQAAKEWLKKAKAGTLGTRTGGGARLSPLEKEQRGIVEEYLKAAGWKAADAKKEAKDPRKGFKTMLALQLAKGKNIPLNQVEVEDIETAFGKNWPKVEKMAQQRIDMAQDLDFDM
jgi:hypothetical protein